MKEDLERAELLAPYTPYGLIVEKPDGEKLYSVLRDGNLLFETYDLKRFTPSSVVPRFRPFEAIAKEQHVHKYRTYSYKRPTTDWFANKLCIVPAIEIARLAARWDPAHVRYEVYNRKTKVVQVVLLDKDFNVKFEVYIDALWDVEVWQGAYITRTYDMRAIQDIFYRYQIVPPEWKWDVIWRED